ncbi:MAG: transcriptional regulator [Rhodospirillaceae bacterium]|nr:MAG: transcriptional regulator [Rhodospirillaceae bacterium]
MTAFNKIMAGAKDALAYVEGNDATAYLHEMTAVDVKRIRAKTGLSQTKFANLFKIAVGTLRNWEQGRRHPEGPAVALLHIIDKEPETTMRALHS